MALLKTVDDTCDFIGEWCREQRSYPGRPLQTDFAVPDCIARLNARLGGLWPGPKRQPGPIVEYPRRFLDLLNQQDEIVNPRKYARDKDGFVAFINENQHVWQFGFDPNDAGQLLVRGDCTFGPRGAAGFEWDLVEASTEDALVFTLLVNLSMSGPEAEWDGDVPRPDAAHLALWQHPAWQSNDFDGFWINDERTLIYYSGWQVTRR